MNKKIIIIVLVASLLTLALVACVPNDVKEAVDAQSPGAKIISTQKSTESVGGIKAWCVVYQQKDGIKSRMIVTENLVIIDASVSTFKSLGCTN